MSEKRKCFIIQPLKEKYKKRCEETYKPSIKKAGLVPYRVDEDYDAVKLKIQTIREEIEKSAVCLAEISEDNPNVWYELGFADGHDVPVVLICEKDKRDKLPFDVNQRDTYFYGTDSQGDWEKLQEEIAKRLRKAVSGEKPAKKEKRSVATGTSCDADEFEGAELAILALLYCNPDLNNSEGGVSSLIKTMEMLEYSQRDREDAFWRLEFREMIEITPTFEDEAPYCSLTRKGRALCSSDQRRLESVYLQIRNFEP